MFLHDPEADATGIARYLKTGIPLSRAAAFVQTVIPVKKRELSG